MAERRQPGERQQPGAAQEWRRSDGRIGADEITVRDGHLRIRLIRMENGWHARIDSDLEGHIFEGHVTELSDLLAGHPAAAAALSALPPDLD